MFLVLIGTLIPTTQFAGLVDPVSSLEGVGRAIGEVYPATWFITAARGAFSKSFGFVELIQPTLAMAASVPIILGLSVSFLKKQER